MNKQLKSGIYNKLLLQANEAKIQSMVKLAEGVMAGIGAVSLEDGEVESYNFEDLEASIYGDLWKAAASVMKYHDVADADIERLGKTIERFAGKLIGELEQSLDVSADRIGPLEEKVLGQE